MINRKNTGVLVLASLFLVLGAWQVSAGGYMLAKAWLSQYLIASAWHKTLEDKQHHQPWSWADGYPVAQLNVPRLNKSRYILSSSSARNLAFAAAHLPQSGMPGDSQSVVIAGHNDSHFAFLSDLVLGDVITMTSIVKKQTVQTNYQVQDINIIDSQQNNIHVTNQDELILLTCYPFNSITGGSGLRYVIKAMAQQ